MFDFADAKVFSLFPRNGDIVAYVFILMIQSLA